MTTKTSFADLPTNELTAVTGGGTRASGGDDAKLRLMLTSITDSIKEVATSKSSSSDQMMPMMMMGGGGGSTGGAAAAAAPPPPATVIKVNVRR